MKCEIVYRNIAFIAWYQASEYDFDSSKVFGFIIISKCFVVCNRINGRVAIVVLYRKELLQDAQK